MVSKDPKDSFILTVLQGEKQKFKEQSQPVETLDSKSVIDSTEHFLNGLNRLIDKHTFNFCPCLNTSHYFSKSETNVKKKSKNTANVF